MNLLMDESSKVGFVCHFVLIMCFIFVVFSRNDSLKVDMITVALVESRESERCSDKMDFVKCYRNLFVTNEHFLIVSFATNENQPL